jgi:hypothetical protein
MTLLSCPLVTFLAEPLINGSRCCAREFLAEPLINGSRCCARETTARSCTKTMRGALLRYPTSWETTQRCIITCLNWSIKENPYAAWRCVFPRMGMSG